MTKIENFDTFKDSEIIKLVEGKMVQIRYRDGSSKKGLVTNFIGAAIADDADRTTVGFILNEEEVSLSKDIIDCIIILN
ncbi:MAG TPA: hypothetical protein DEB74_18615 [Lachnospiraceae bacterium]|nr:hypothetical protein [Lachnospiraceae bacterium]